MDTLKLISKVVESLHGKRFTRVHQVCEKRNLKCFMYCNGARLNGQFMRDVIDAGIDFVRVSVIGYNSEKYEVDEYRQF